MRFLDAPKASRFLPLLVGLGIGVIAINKQGAMNGLGARFLWAATLVALGYTTFAWPGVLLAHLWVFARVLERGEYKKAFVGLLPFLSGVACALAPLFLLMIDRMSYAVRGEAGEGGLVPIGAVIALLAGPTVQASVPVVSFASLVTGAGALFVLWNASGRGPTPECVSSLARCRRWSGGVFPR